MRSSDIHLRAISQEIPRPSITKIHLKITYLKFHSNLPGANALTHWPSGKYGNNFKYNFLVHARNIEYFLWNCSQVHAIEPHWYKSTLVKVMAWCRKVTSHYLSQCWPRSISPYDTASLSHNDLIQAKHSSVSISYNSIKVNVSVTSTKVEYRSNFQLIKDTSYLIQPGPPFTNVD